MSNAARSAAGHTAGTIASSPVSSQWRDPSRILRELTDLFVSRHAPAAIEILRYEEIASGLIDRADAPTLAYAAVRLAGHPCAPVVVLDALLAANRTCAKILAEHSPRLSPAPLLAFAEGSDGGLAAAVARRAWLTPALTAVLAARPEPEVLQALAANPQVDIAGDTLDRMTRAARTDRELARLLLMRCKDEALQETLFLSADPATRRLVLARLENRIFTASEIQSVRAAGPALRAWMLRKSPRGDSARFAHEFARLTGLPRDLAMRLVEDEAGDGLALLFAAIAVPSDLATRLFLRCGPTIAHSIDRIRDLRAIVESTPAHAALRLLRSIAAGDAAAGPQAQARYQPLHDVSAKPLAARPSTVPANATSAHPATRTAQLRHSQRHTG